MVDLYGRHLICSYDLALSSPLFRSQWLLVNELCLNPQSHAVGTIIGTIPVNPTARF
ncbi:Hypothetical protein FKW44_017480 [Caligus rogercresseyi]|uniref:Uncharacterized protein n=1 Tax=Caligus rogercresseyi TaxID=217165 RepID=A0A7T8JWQ2_CALRO|nr:Hypothetical protein FKW44_017480 [Caligus rogercresseyi]